MSKRKTHEQFLLEFKSKNHNYENIQFLSKYISANEKIKCKCKIDKYEWNSTPSRLLHGKGCPMCAGNAKHTTEEIKDDLLIHGFELLSTYNGIHSKIHVRCLKCDYSYWSEPNVLLNKKCGCPNCYGNVKKTHDVFIEELSLVNDTLNVLGLYQGANTPIQVECNVCHNKWSATPSNLLRGHGCNVCSSKIGGEKNRRNPEEIHSIIMDKNPDIEIIEGFITLDKYMKCHCKKCGCTWYASPINLTRGTGCPTCRKSLLERCVLIYLNKHNLDFTSQFTFDDLYGVGNRKLSYDFYLKEYNLLIECQGVQHEKPIDFSNHGDMKTAIHNFEIQQEHDKRKKEYAQFHNIQLLEIWYNQISYISDILNEYFDNK